MNTDLVNKVVNLASRTAKFVEGTGLSAKYPDDGGLFAAAAKAGDEIRDAYEATDYSKAMRLIMGLADRANPYVEERKPWELRKDPAQSARAARCVHGRAQPVPPDRRVPGARAAAAGRANRRAAERSDRAAGTNRKSRSSARRSPSSRTCSTASKKRTCTP